MIGRALALGLASLFLATPAAFADEASDAMDGVAIPTEAEEEEEKEPPNWARTGLYLEVDGEAIFEAFSSSTNRGKPISSVGGGLSVRAGWRPARPLAFELQYERVFDFFCGTTTDASCLDSNDANLITVNAKYNLLVERRYQPFIRTGFGAIWGDLPNSWTRKVDPGQSSFVWKIGAGIDYAITERWFGSLYGDWVIPTQEFHRLNYGTLGLGIGYKF
jgi:opacity protein-like surface antigen